MLAQRSRTSPQRSRISAWRSAISTQPSETPTLSIDRLGVDEARLQRQSTLGRPPHAAPNLVLMRFSVEHPGGAARPVRSPVTAHRR
jgi:hypothetical protein